MMNKALIILGVFVLVIVLGVGGFFLLRGEKEQSKEVSFPTPEAYVETSLEERPFVSIIPSEDGHWLTLRVARIQGVETLEYELIYETRDGLSQGAIGGPFDLLGREYEKKILLGTESSGHYRYHEGVEEGSLTIRLDGGRGPRKFVSEFHLQEGDNELTSVDAQFSLRAQFPPGQFYVVMPTVGLPEELPITGTVIGAPYGVFTSGAKAVRSGGLSLGLKVLGGTQLFSWTDATWEEISADRDIDKGELTAAVDNLGVFVAVEGYMKAH